MKILCCFISSALFLIYSQAKGQSFGCTDPLAANYNSSAQFNDGSCTYANVFITPDLSINLSDSLIETSGLISWNNKIWTHNDNSDNHLYALDSTNGNIISKVALNGLVNKDWEEISQDDNYIYIGDFGNNVSGNRSDLMILRIAKQSILNNSPLVDTIFFSYSNQTDLTAKSNNQTDFDCEAFVVTTDSIYLFTKQWLSNKTSLYALPKSPGTYVAQLKFTYDVQGLITGATYMPSHKLIALCGYSSLLQPFIYLLYDFNGTDFFNGNKRKIALSLSFHQVEGIATSDGLHYFISNERYVNSPLINNAQKLHMVDLSTYLKDYFTGGTIQNIFDIKLQEAVSIYPNPSSDLIYIETDHSSQNYLLMDALGQVVLQGQLTQGKNKVSISELPAGMYLLRIGQYRKSLVKQ